MTSQSQLSLIVTAGSDKGALWLFAGFLTLGVPFDQAKATGNRRNSLEVAASAIS